MSTIKKILAIIILVILAFVYSHVDKQHEIYNADIDSSEYVNTGVLVNEVLEQDFCSTEDTLSGIRIKCATFGEREDVIIKFTISREDGSVACTQDISGAEFENNKFFRLSFDEIEGCKNETMHLTMEFAGGDETDGICVYIENAGEGKQYFRDGKSMDGTLLVQTITHRFDFETFFVVLLFEAYLVAFMKIMYKLFK